jgi:outer membrane protein
MRIFFFFGLVWFLGITNAFSITLEEAVRQALESSDQAMIIQETKKQSEARAREITAFTLPQIDATASYLEMGSGVEVNTGFPALDPILASPDRQLAAKLAASQVLWSGGRVWNSYELKNELLMLSQLQETSQKTELTKQVSYAFISYLYQHARLAVLNDRVAQRKDELQDATDLFEAGMVTNLDVREARLNLNIATDDLRSGESKFHIALVDFNLVIGRHLEKKLLQPGGNLTRPEELVEMLSQLESRFQSGTQLDLKMARHQLETSKMNLKMANGERWPLLLLVAEGEYSGEESSEMEESWAAGVQLRWNLYDGGTVSSKKAAARADMRNNQAVLHRTEKALHGTINKLKTEVDRLNKRIQLQEQTVALSGENYEDARGLYGHGTMTLTRLGDFNLLFAEARFNLLRLYFFENRISMNVAALLQ